MKVARRYKFRASHSLPGVEGYDQPHEHDYTVEVVASHRGTQVMQEGMVVDTAALDDIMEPLCKDLADSDLNEATGLFTTVENLAAYICLKVSSRPLAQVGITVTVWEDDDRWGQAP